MLAQAAASKKHSLVPVNPTSLLPDATTQERSYFDVFQGCIVEGFTGTFDGLWWSSYVLKAAVAEPMVLHAALAFASTNRATDSDEKFALKHYNRAMAQLQASLIKTDYPNASILLLTSLLLACLAFARDNQSEAFLHLRGGRAILDNILVARSMPAIGDAECCVTKAFRRLETGATLSLSTVPIPNWFSHWAAKKKASQDTPKLDNVEALREVLDRLATAVVGLMQDIKELPTSAQPLSRDEYPLQFRLHEMSTASNEWLAALNYIESYTIPSIPNLAARGKAERAARILRIHHFSARILLATSLADGHESLFDEYLNDFKTLVDLAIPLASYFQSTAAAFTLDIGILPSLHLTISKCRDPLTRHRALDFLTSLTHREGAWDAQVCASSARIVVKLEEDAAVALNPGARITEAAHIPEVARISEVYFDKDVGQSLAHCKRRRLESDGEWISWTQAVR